jgi:hypothetical protein
VDGVPLKVNFFQLNQVGILVATDRSEKEEASARFFLFDRNQVFHIFHTYILNRKKFI